MTLVKRRASSAVVSGLVSRTVLRDAHVGPGEFHACRYLGELAPFDLFSGGEFPGVGFGSWSPDWRPLPTFGGGACATIVVGHCRTAAVPGRGALDARRVVAILRA